MECDRPFFSRISSSRELVWCFILYTILSSVIFGFVIAKSKPSQRKFWYSFGLIFGGLGLISMFFIHNQWLLIISFIFIGINNLTMNTQPFTLLTEAIDGENSGAYLGLFNTSICLPQIVASVASFALFPLLGSSMPAMLLFAGIMMLLGAISVKFINAKF